MIRSRSLAPAIVTALMLTACATPQRVEPTPAPQSQPAPVASTAAATTTGAFDPVGSYTFSVSMQGNAIPGTMNLRKGSDGKLGGEMTSDQGSLTFTEVNLDGRKMTAYGSLNGTDLVFFFEFVGDDFSGNLSTQGTVIGGITGSRRKN